ncbi:MAG: hypothetical protein JJU29_23955 [Verrucomicrobia bacterium]|nr:hypothetical protein [Verrucomicrobiota bacterium]
MITQNPINPVGLAERLAARLDKMTPAQRKQSLVDAGILTPKGNLRKVYKPILQVLHQG